MQERRNPIVNALELRISCTYPPIWCIMFNGSFHIFSASHIILYEPYSSDTNALSKSFLINVHRTRGMYLGLMSIYAHFPDPSNQPAIKENACHYRDVIMSTMASQITGVSIVCSAVCSGTDKKKTSKLRVTVLCVGNSPRPVNSPLKRPVTRKMFPFDDVIMLLYTLFEDMTCNNKAVVFHELEFIPTWTTWIKTKKSMFDRIITMYHSYHVVLMTYSVSIHYLNQYWVSSPTQIYINMLRIGKG